MHAAHSGVQPADVTPLLCRVPGRRHRVCGDVAAGTPGQRHLRQCSRGMTGERRRRGARGGKRSPVPRRHGEPRGVPFAMQCRPGAAATRPGAAARCRRARCQQQWKHTTGHLRLESRCPCSAGAAACHLQRVVAMRGAHSCCILSSVNVSLQFLNPLIARLCLRKYCNRSRKSHAQISSSILHRTHSTHQHAALPNATDTFPSTY